MTSKALRELILWLRKERISYTTLTAGPITIDGVVDGKVERRIDKPEPRLSMFAEYGAELLKASAVSPSASITDDERLE